MTKEFPKKTLLLFALCISFGCYSFSQISVSLDFNSTTSPVPGWAYTGFARSTTTPCEGVASVRGNRWSGSTTGSIASPTYTSSGENLTLSFNYKIINFTGGAATSNTPAWGSIIAEVSIDGGTTYTITAGTINASNHIASAACASSGTYTVSGASLPAGNNIKIRLRSQWLSGDYWVYFDNVSFNQAAGSCPIPSSLTSSNITMTSASISWACSSCTGTYRMEYGVAPTTVGNPSNIVIEPATSPVALTGLTLNTTYMIFVRQNCSTSNSAYANHTFTTASLGEACSDVATLPVAANAAAATNTTFSSGLTADGPPGTCSDVTGNPNKKDRWFKFVAPSNGKKIIINTTAGTLGDWVMQVWSGCPASGTALGCSDDVNGLMPQIELCQDAYTAGNTYYVQVWPYSATSTGTLNVKIFEDTGCPIPPPNNECTGAVMLSINPANSCTTSQTNGTTINATPSAGVVKTVCDAFGTYNDVFYKFNSGNDTTVHLNFNSLTGVCEFGIYSGCGTTYLGVCNSASTFSNNISGLLPNTNYTIVVWSNPGASGNFSICLTCVERIYYADTDADGFGNPNSTLSSCTLPLGYIVNSLDCDDTNPAINPTTIWYRDLDQDGYGDESITLVQCLQPEGYILIGNDCDDNASGVNPSSAEVCDQIDNDCDGNVDDADSSITGQSSWFPDSDQDGYGNASAQPVLACIAPQGYLLNHTDCNDNAFAINPAAGEICDNIDNDCDTQIDEVCGCTNPAAHNYNPTATLDDGSCQTCTDGIKNGTEVGIDCGGTLCPVCPPPVAVCGNIVTVTVSPIDLLYNGPGTSDVYKISPQELSVGSTSSDPNGWVGSVKRDLTSVAFNWTTNGACVDATPNSVYNNNDKGIVFKPCLPVAPADFNKIRNFTLTITDMFGTSTCTGKALIVYSPTNTNAIVQDGYETEISFRSVKPFEVYPNPGIDEITVEFDFNPEFNYSLQFFDNLGRNVKTLYYVNHPLSGVSTEDLPVGSYTILLKGKEEVQTTRWIKIK